MDQKQQVEMCKMMAEKVAKAIHADVKKVDIDPAVESMMLDPAACAIAGGAACAASCYIPWAGPVLSVVGNSAGVAAAKAL